MSRISYMLFHLFPSALVLQLYIGVDHSPRKLPNTCTSPHDIITSLSDPRGWMVSAETFGTLLGSLNENTFGLILTKKTLHAEIFLSTAQCTFNYIPQFD